MQLLAQQAVQGVIPDVAWSLIAPFVVLAVGGILLITITSVLPALRFNGFPAGFTIFTAAVSAAFLIPVWNRVTDDGPQSVVGRRPRRRPLLALLVGRDLPGGVRRRCAARRLPEARGPRRARVVRADAHVGLGRHAAGRGPGPDPHLPRARDPLDRGLRAGRAPPPPLRFPGGGVQVLRARRPVVGRVPLRHRPGLRGHRLDRPRRDRRGQGRQPGRPEPAGELVDGPGRDGHDPRRLRLQGVGRPVPHVDPRRLPGLAVAGGRLHGLGGQGRRLRRADPGLLAGLRLLLRGLAGPDDRVGRSVAAGRLVPGPAPDQRQADAGLLVDRPRRLHAHRGAGHRLRRHRDLGPGGRGAAVLPAGLHDHGRRHVRGDHPGRGRRRRSW